MTSFSLGFWGNYHIHKRMLLYVDTMLYRRLQCHDSLTVWVALMSDCNLFIASRIIALRRIYPELKLCVVITDKQHGAYISGQTVSNYDKKRNEAIAASASSAIIPDNAAYVRTVYSNRIFLKRCDEIIYCDTKIDSRAKHDLDGQYRLLAEPKPMITDMMSEYPIAKPHDFSAALDFTKAVELMCKYDFDIDIAALPLRLVDKWSVPPPKDCEELLVLTPEEIYALEDDGRNEYLSLKVFLFAYNHFRGSNAPITDKSERKSVTELIFKFTGRLAMVAKTRRKRISACGEREKMQLMLKTLVVGGGK